MIIILEPQFKDDENKVEEIKPSLEKGGWRERVLSFSHTVLPIS